MGFKKDGMSASRAFSGGGNKTGNFAPNPYTRLIDVLGYNLPQATIVGRDVDTGKLLEARVDPTRVAEISQRAKVDSSKPAPAWQGHLINEDMAKEHPVGTRLILEGSIPVGRPVKRDDNEYMQIQARYISAPSDPSPEKARRAIITGEAYERRFSSVQEWSPRALDIQDNEAEVHELFAQMDAVRAEDAAGKKPVGLGILLRAIVPLSNEEREAAKRDGREGPAYEVIDKTEAFHWVSPKRDENGNKVAEGHPMGSAEGTELIGEYLDYLNEKFPDGSFGPDRDFRVEVLHFKNYKASIKSKFMAVPDRGPLASLVTTPTKCAQDDDKFTFGRNWAVNGILCLTRDVAPEKKGDDWVERNMADRVFAEGYRADVASMVLSADGSKVRLVKELIAPRPEYDQNQNAGASRQQSPAQSSQAPAQQAPANQPAPAGDGFSDFDGGSNAFEAAMRSSAPAESAPPAEEAAPAPEATASETAPKTSGWGRNRRPA